MGGLDPHIPPYLGYKCVLTFKPHTSILPRSGLRSQSHTQSTGHESINNHLSHQVKSGSGFIYIDVLG